MKNEDRYQWYLLLKEAKEIGLSVEEIKNWLENQKKEGAFTNATYKKIL